MHRAYWTNLWGSCRLEVGTEIIISSDVLVDEVPVDVTGVTTSEMAWEVASVITRRVVDREDHMDVFF
jgi:hypothetical protein